MATSNNLTALLNFISIMSSIPILTSGIWLSSQPSSHCIHFLFWPIISLGSLFLLISLTGFIGSYYNKPTLLSLYLRFAAISIILSLSFLLLAIVVTPPSSEYSVVGRRFEEYRLGWFSAWLREHVVGDDSWGKIRVCLVENHVCEKLQRGDFVSAEQFFPSHLSPLQRFTVRLLQATNNVYVNPTTWVNPVNPVADPDCSIWSNDPTQLCYGCDSCKAGLLGILRNEWRKANVILIVAIVILIYVYLIACSTLKNAESGGFGKSRK
ncbi:hypothetical protein LguiB_018282 [Lonicera macranthoides]